jgi:transposase-like protein
MGIESWIQGITGWQPTVANKPTPELTPEEKEEIAEAYLESQLEEGFVAAQIHPESVIAILRDSKFKTAGFKLYFYLEMAHIQERQPTVAEICQDLNISESSFRRWLPEVHEWSRCADWLQLKHREGPEREIQLRLHRELGGTMEAYTPVGPIDLVTTTEIIEIKRINDWKTALGQVFAKAYMFPRKHKRIHLFGDSSRQLKKITSHCHDLDVTVTFEKN